MDPETTILEMGLQPHPEGGHYREIFRSSSWVRPSDDRDRRSALTAIQFMLRQGEHSRWHRVRSDEVWHHAGGGTMGLWTLSPDLDQMEYLTLGAMDQGAAPMHVVPANWWQAAQPVLGPSLCTCLVAPGFDFTDFSFMTEPTQQQVIRAKWPELAFLI